jgi:hypothetical protein
VSEEHARAGVSASGERPELSERGRAAVAYAEEGIRVHPLWDGQKRPRLDAWQEQATTDPERVRDWWTTWPEANVGAVPDEGWSWSTWTARPTRAGSWAS